MLIERFGSEHAWLAAAAMLAAIVGVAVPLGKPVMLAAAFGSICIAVLVMHPVALLWFTVGYGLVVGGSLYYFAGLRNADYVTYLAAGTFVAVSAASLFSSKYETNASCIPSFLFLLACFCVVLLASSLASFDSLPIVLVGIRSYFLCFGVTLGLFFVPWERITIERIARGILAIGLLQLPVSMFQFLVVRSQRIARGGFHAGDGTIEASDTVVGTFGGAMYGGGLADLLAQLQIILLAGVLAMFLQSAISRRRALLLSLALGMPLLLTEAKTVFVALPVAFVIVGGRWIRRNPGKVAAGLLSLVFLMPAALWGYYKIHWSTQYGDFVTALTKMTEYSIAATPKDAMRGEMSRVEAIQYWWDHQTITDPGTFLFGNGMASSRSDLRIARTHLVSKHGGLPLDRSALTCILWEAGLVGTALFFAVLGSAYLLGNRVAQDAGLTPFERAVVKGAQVAIAVVVIWLPFSMSFLRVAQGALIPCLALGLIAYYARATRT